MRDYNFSPKVKENMVKLGPHLYVSSDDPEFFKKYLKYFPNDEEKLYLYAKDLESKGMFEEALSYYERASKNGSLPAYGKLKELENLRLKKMIQTTTKSNPIKKSKSDIAFILFLAFLSILALLAFIFFINKYFHYQENEYHYYQKDVQYIHPSSESPYQPSLKTEENEDILLSDFPTLAYENALFRFFEEKGFFPSHPKDLISKNPENWISYMPKNIGHYSKAGSPFLAYNRDEPSSTSTPPFELLELHFYPATNQLALANQNKVLALYTVASGSKGKELPFKESKVMNRVINPNGGNGGLGTRGLELERNYAIHGTNKPSLIGQYITGGCLRMSNHDIEILYPYISKGTPFKVKKGTPPKPLFSEGIPPIENFKNQIDFPPQEEKSEETSTKHYNWKS